MYIIRKYHQQIDRFICSWSCGAFSRAYGLLVVVLAALAALVFKFGAPANNGRPWDSPIILAGAWRILNGQVPHRDFYNFLGDLPFYMTALGMKLGRPSATAIDYGNVILMALMAVPVMAVLRRRTSALLAFLYSLFIALLVITPRPMGDPYDFTDHAMLYNRYGEAFIALLGAIFFLPPRPSAVNKWADWAEAVLAGVVMIALLGCKLNYFFIGVGFFAVACVLGWLRPGRALLCLGSAAAFLAIALALSKIPLSDLVKDYRMMSATQGLGRRIPTVIIQGIKNIFFLPVLLLLIWEGRLGNAERGDHRKAPWQQVVVIVVIFGSAVLLLASNCQLGDMPLLALGALFGAELVQRQASASTEAPFFVTARHLGALLLFLLFAFPSIVTDFKTIRFVTFAAVKKNWDVPEAAQSTRLNDFRFILHDGTRRLDMEKCMADLSDGLQLLRRHPDPKMRLNAILYDDPFQVALGLVPATGGLISTDGLSPISHQSLAQLLGNATHILAVKGYPKFKEVYGADWDALHLEVVEEAKIYTLYKIPEEQRARLEKAQRDGLAR